MPAILSNPPKSLLALLAFCILVGYQAQIQCKLGGCQADAIVHTDNGGETSDHLPDADSGGHHCQCQCHFVTFALGQTPDVHVQPFYHGGVSLPTRGDHAPEAPCAEIEHPPQLA